MTIRELHETTDKNTKIFIYTGGEHIQLNRSDIFSLCAFGDYLINEIYIFDKESLSASVKMQPVKKEG